MIAPRVMLPFVENCFKHGTSYVLGNPWINLNIALQGHKMQHPLASRIHRYGFFTYSVSEALFLSEKEKHVIRALFESIAIELGTHSDYFSLDVLVSQIELLLHHCNRFYNRQFLTRNVVHHDLMNAFLNERFEKKEAMIKGLPTPQEIAEELKVSSRYLSYILKSLTAQTTQQHIHLKMVEKAKEMMGSDTITTADVAYALGFEHPQSFNKLFKQKRHVTRCFS